VELAKRVSLPPGLTLDRYCSCAQPPHDLTYSLSEGSNIPRKLSCHSNVNVFTEFVWVNCVLKHLFKWTTNYERAFLMCLVRISAWNLRLGN